ncbi:MAG: endolytic transglycosylase MltG [Fibrella sp.]|nr:endolytic transglycosylase MltG [Armatimonadota bacterium]
MIIPEPTDPSIPSSPPKKRFPVAVVVAVLFAMILVGGAVGLNLYIRWAKQPALKTGRPARITVPPGSTVDFVGKKLEASRLIRDARVFAMSAKGVSIRPGTYDIAPTESVATIISRLEKGDVVTVRVTFPEGFTLRQIAKRLAKNELCEEETFYKLVSERGNTLKASFQPPAKLEGYLFPDTYRFPLGEEEADIAQRMLSSFDSVFAKRHGEDIRRSGRTVAELVNVAAMVEREARTAGDRPLIAGVIYNRLQRGMRLQIDATVQYARGEHKERLLYRDLEIESPYNTYRVAGLPAGPICNPGASALEAALHPATHDFLFYVARTDGSHVFGKTLADHNRNIATVRQSR